MASEKNEGVAEEEIEKLYEKLSKEAEEGSYNLNPDPEFAKELVKGLLVNERRYGYGACPCRLPSGKREEDLDIICPCDYRDEDLNEFGCCYCALYVSGEIREGRKKARSIPERRLNEEERKKKKEQGLQNENKGVSYMGMDLTNILPYPVWRCKVCGYLCARKEPPEICPICKAKKERFGRFI